MAKIVQYHVTYFSTLSATSYCKYNFMLNTLVKTSLYRALRRLKSSVSMSSESQMSFRSAMLNFFVNFPSAAQVVGLVSDGMLQLQIAEYHLLFK